MPVDECGRSDNHLSDVIDSLSRSIEQSERGSFQIPYSLYDPRCQCLSKELDFVFWSSPGVDFQVEKHYSSGDWIISWRPAK